MDEEANEESRRESLEKNLNLTRDEDYSPREEESSPDPNLRFINHDRVSN